MRSAKRVRLIKGSHIVVPRLYRRRAPLHPAERRQADRVRDPVRRRLQPDRHHRRALRGRPRRAAASPRTRPTICVAWSTATSSAQIGAADVVWSYAGVRPLYDDASGDASAVTRDYVFDLDAGQGAAPLLSVFGGKITTYRKLAEHALAKLQPVMGFAARPHGPRPRPCPAAISRARTSTAFLARPAPRHPWLPVALAAALGPRLRHAVRRTSLGGAGGCGISAATSAAASTRPRSTIWCDHEWARTAEDMLWRRSRLGLHVGDGHGGRLRRAARKRGRPAPRRAAAP